MRARIAPQSTVLPVALVLACGSAFAAAPRPQVPAPAPAPDAERAEGVPFLDLTLADAISRAENEKRLLLVFWTSESYSDCVRMRTTTFQDPQLGDWVRRGALAVEIDGPKNTPEAAQYRVTAYPCVDLYDPLLGLGIERLVGYSTADDLLASFSGALVGGGASPKPDGAALEDPYAWLAYANYTWRNPATAEDSARAYAWVLRNGETHRAGFRARYFEFLLRRLAYLKPHTLEAFRALDDERMRVEGLIYTGRVDERTVYELVRLDWWLRREHRTRESFEGLAGRGESGQLARRLLFRYVLDDLGRNQAFAELLAGLEGEAPIAYLNRRLDELEADVAAQAGGKTLAPEEVDDRGVIVLAASWIYEALLATGRGGDAEAVVELVEKRLASGRAFSLLVERALRQQQLEVAVRVGNRGLAAIAGTQGERQLRRVVTKIPGYIPPSEPSSGGGD